tara:strand:+ start:106 stop:378 length:273 start_codon:yes stop_codon:yes gene_type:complete
MIQIKPIPVGYPSVKADALQISYLTAKSSDLTCNTYYELFKSSVSEEGDVTYTKLAEGNYELTEDQYDSWGLDNEVLEDIVLKELHLERA